MDPLNIECDLHSLRRLYGLLLQSNANKESLHQAFLLDENTQILLKRLLDSATDELLARQSKVLAQAQLGLPERVSKNSVSRSIIKLPSSKAGLTEEVVDSIERIETQLSAFRFCSTRVVSHGDRTRSWKSPIVNNNAAVATVRRRFDPTLTLHSQGSCSHDDDQIVLVRSRPPLPPRPLRSVGFKKPRQSNKTTQKIASMKPTLLDQRNETWDEHTGSGTSSSGEEQDSYTDQESEEVSGETVSTSGSSWETHAESVTESGSSFPSESDDDGDDDDDDDENSQVSDSSPHKRRDRSREPAKQRKKAGRLKRFKDKLGKIFHHHHHHHHHHQPKEEEGRKLSGWKRLVKKHLKKDKEKLAERRWKQESKGLTTHKDKGGQFHALVKGFMRHHRRHSKKQKQKLQSHGRKMNWWENPKRQGRVKFPKAGQVKLGQTNYLCNKDLERDEN